MVTFIDSFDEMSVLPLTEEMRSFAPTVEPLHNSLLWQ